MFRLFLKKYLWMSRFSLCLFDLRVALIVDAVDSMNSVNIYLEDIFSR